MTNYPVSGDLYEPPYGVGAQSGLRIFNTYRWHVSGPARLIISGVRDSKDQLASPYVGLRLALHQNGVQKGPTLTFFNELGANKSFDSPGPLPNGQYAMWGRTQRLSNAGAFQQPPIIYFSGTLVL